MPAAKLTLGQLAEVARLHVEACMPISELARIYWRDWGFQSERTAASAICHRLRRHGYYVAAPHKPSSGRTKTSLRVEPRKATAKMTRKQVLAAHRIYREGVSLEKLGQMLWERFGYASPRTAETALREQFHREGLAVRSRSESLTFIRGADVGRVIALYEEGQSTYQIARENWAAWGFKTEGAARRSVGKLLSREGVPRRTGREVALLRESRRRGDGSRLRHKLYCIHGHPYTPENTVTTGGRRRCRTCHQKAARRSYAKQRAA